MWKVVWDPDFFHIKTNQDLVRNGIDGALKGEKITCQNGEAPFFITSVTTLKKYVWKFNNFKLLQNISLVLFHNKTGGKLL